jgi:T-complex protein 1 subunit theta
MILVGELLKNAESLITMGLHCSDIISGYEKGAKAALEIVEDLCVETVQNANDVDEVDRYLQTAIASKMYGYEDFLSELVGQACVNVCEGGKKFDNDNIRVLKVLGGNLTSSVVIKGMVCQRPCETSVHKVTKARIAVFNCPFDP